MTRDFATYANGNGKHAYEVETATTIFTVWANNRDQAARRVERNGYTVRSVNMVG